MQTAIAKSAVGLLCLATFGSGCAGSKQGPRLSNSPKDLEPLSMMEPAHGLTDFLWPQQRDPYLALIGLKTASDSECVDLLRAPAALSDADYFQRTLAHYGFKVNSREQAEKLRSANILVAATEDERDKVKSTPRSYTDFDNIQRALICHHLKLMRWDPTLISKSEK